MFKLSLFTTFGQYFQFSHTHKFYNFVYAQYQFNKHSSITFKSWFMIYFYVYTTILLMFKKINTVIIVVN